MITIDYHYYMLYITLYYTGSWIINHPDFLWAFRTYFCGAWMCHPHEAVSSLFQAAQRGHLRVVEPNLRMMSREPYEATHGDRWDSCAMVIGCYWLFGSSKFSTISLVTMVAWYAWSLAAWWNPWRVPGHHRRDGNLAVQGNCAPLANQWSVKGYGWLLMAMVNRGEAMAPQATV